MQPARRLTVAAFVCAQVVPDGVGEGDDFSVSVEAPPGWCPPDV